MVRAFSICVYSQLASIGGAYFAWNSPLVISMLIIGSLSLIIFVIIEWRVAKLPMMPGQLCSAPTKNLSNLSPQSPYTATQ